ncbi:MAG: NfeD family protein [Sporichthyaceae bacterium]
MHGWAWWLIVAAAFAVVEIVTLDLIFAMLAAGALIAALIAVLGAGVPVQVAVGLVATVAGLAVLRPVALRHLKSTPQLRTGVAALVGREAVVLTRVDGRSGQVKLAGEVWSARSLDEMSVFEVGQEVQVLKIDGATALIG